MESKTIEILFVEWNAWVNSGESSRRGKDRIKPNFEDLFEKWKKADATFDDLYETWLPKAIKAHQPSSSRARGVYDSFRKKFKINKTEKEFIEEWNGNIANLATETFFEFFPAPRLDVDDEPKVYGSMSAKEYAAQRRHADQYPTIDTAELKRLWKEQQYNTNIDDLIGNILGDKE